MSKTYSIQIIERLKIISENKAIYKYIVKSISLYPRGTSSFVSKDLFTRREGYPSKRIKVSSSLQANFTGRVTLSH